MFKSRQFAARQFAARMFGGDQVEETPDFGGWTMEQGTIWTGNPRQENEIIILRRPAHRRVGV